MQSFVYSHKQHLFDLSLFLYVKSTESLPIQEVVQIVAEFVVQVVV